MARDWLIYLQESDNNKEVKPLLEGILGNFINCTNSKQKSVNLLKILETNFSTNPNTSVKVNYIFLILDVEAGILKSAYFEIFQEPCDVKFEV